MSFRPMALYEPDSDDSSDEEGGLVNGTYGGAAMGIAGYGNKEETMSLDSDLFEEVEHDHFMPSSMSLKDAIQYGKGLDLYKDTQEADRDKDYTVPTMGMRLMQSLDADEHSIGSDDEYIPHGVPKVFTKNDKHFDELMPTSGNAEVNVKEEMPPLELATYEAVASRSAREDSEAAAARQASQSASAAAVRQGLAATPSNRRQNSAGTTPQSEYASPANAIAGAGSPPAAGGGSAKKEITGTSGLRVAPAHNNQGSSLYDRDGKLIPTKLTVEHKTALREFLKTETNPDVLAKIKQRLGIKD